MENINLVIFNNDDRIYNFNSSKELQPHDIELDNFDNEDNYNYEMKNIFYDYYKFDDFYIMIISKGKNDFSNLFINIKFILEIYIKNNSINELTSSANKWMKESCSVLNAKNDINEIKLKINENINTLYDRESDFDNIIKESDDILKNSENFAKRSSQIEKKMKKEKFKRRIIVLILIILFIIIFYFAIGYTK